MDRTESGPDESVLLERLRRGDDTAFVELFQCHATAVRRMALGLTSDVSEADDITAETFFRVLQALRRGNGPRTSLRAYLMTVARRVSWEWHRTHRDVPIPDDQLTVHAGSGADAQARTAEVALLTRAFAALPERWRTVLWQTEVEGEQPAVLGPNLGLSPNATAALARRARIGLRAAYLQAHLVVNGTADGCREVTEKLGAYAAGSVKPNEARKIDIHLNDCRSCRSTHDELLTVCASLRSHASAIALLVPAGALALGAAGGIGAVGGAGSAAAAAGVSTAAGAGGAAGVGGTVLAAVNTNFGLALASAAAAATVGAVGIAVGPALDDLGPEGQAGDGTTLAKQVAAPTTSWLPVDPTSARTGLDAVEPPGGEVKGTPAGEYRLPSGRGRPVEATGPDSATSTPGLPSQAVRPEAGAPDTPGPPDGGTAGSRRPEPPRSGRPLMAEDVPAPRQHSRTDSTESTEATESTESTETSTTESTESAFPPR